MLKLSCKIFTLLFFCFSCIACTPKVISEQGKTTIKVNNFNFYGESQKVSIVKTPRRAIVYGSSALDTLIALNVGDKVTAALVTDGLPLEHYRQKLPNAQIYTQALSLEKVIELQPDFLLAWRRFFSDKQLGDSAIWLQRGIPAYIQDASSPIPAKGNFPACTVVSELNFIRNMGIIFEKQQASEKIIADIQAKLKPNSKLPPKNNKVLVVEFINGTIEVFGQDLLSGDIIKYFGGNIIEYGAPFVSQEELTTINVDHIFVVYHGGAQEAAAALRHIDNPLYKHLRAVQEGNIYPLNYRLIVAPGVNLLQSVDYIYNCLFNKRLASKNNRDLLIMQTPVVLFQDKFLEQFF